MWEHKRFFTVEEANALVPKLSVVVEQIRVIKRGIASKIHEIEPVISKSKSNGGHKNGADYVAKLTEFSEHLNTITGMGCVLKDIDLGLIDFPSIRDQREVYLCWKLGEDKVKFWHELDAGFSGRKLL